jgi:hypothetical protein
MFLKFYIIEGRSQLTQYDFTFTGNYDSYTQETNISLFKDGCIKKIIISNHPTKYPSQGPGEWQQHC